MNKISLLIGALTAVVLTVYLLKYSNELDIIKIDDEFQDFQKRYQIIYTSFSEKRYRLQIFAENLKLIVRHNADPNRTFDVEVNRFADMTLVEMKNYYAASFKGFDASIIAEKCPVSQNLKSVPEAIDWTAKGKVQMVKDQKNCGSCWAFSAIGALESAISIKTGESPLNLSEQELVDCSGSYGNKGCNGGYMHFAYDYIFEHKINQSIDYPYRARTQKCDQSKSDKGLIGITGCIKQRPDVDGLIEALNTGPVAAAVFADILMFFYESGVFNIPEALCNQEPDHGVVVTGYDKSANIPYFLVKNSWGEGWGEKGYFKIAMGKNQGLCRIAGSGLNYYPIVN